MKRADFSSRGLVLGGICFAFLLTACSDAGRDVTPLRVGYMVCNSLEETRTRFGPLSAYLEEQLGREVRPVYLDTVDFEEAVRQDQFDVIHTNSHLYTWFRKDHGFKILSGERRGKNGSFSAGAIVVHADSDLHSVEDLKEASFGFGPPLAPTAFLSQYYLMLEGGIDPEKDLSFYGIPWGSFKHEKAVLGVWFGKYDAGSATLLDLEVMERERKVRMKDLRVIAEGPLIPYCVFSAPASLPEETFRKVQDVLFNLDEKATASFDGEIVKVLKSAGVDGFEPLEEADFEPVDRMARKVKLPPYAEY